MEHLFKRVSVSLLLLIGGIVFFNAQSYNTTVVEATYYGEKANSSYKNPCKGETIRVCGTVKASFEFVSTNSLSGTHTYREIQTVYAADGALLHQASDEIEVPISVTPSQFVINRDMQLYPNASFKISDVSVGPTYPGGSTCD